MKKKKAAGCVLCVLFIAASLFLLQRLLEPKYMSGVTDGALIAEYYDEVKDHDVVFIGDCEVYENFSPQVLWDEYGINSYIRGSAQQLIWQSYYLLEDTFRYETPDVAVFNILSLKYDKPQKEAYNRMTLDGMKWSLSKVRSVCASLTGEEEFLDYVFPILRYHSRWNRLTAEDIKYLFHRDKVSHNGYYMRTDVKPAENVPEGKVLGDYGFGDNAWFYLDKMRVLCEEKGTKLVLVKAPSLYPYWYDEWEEQVEAYARKYGLRYVNLLEKTEEIGLDYNIDTYDAGLHMNLSGAEKLSGYFGAYLSRECGLESRWGEPGLEEAWNRKRQAYEAEIKLQQDRLEQGLAAKP